MMDKLSLCHAALGSDKVLFPGSDAYAAALTSYFSPQVSGLHPQCFVTPRSARDVSCVVETMRATGGEFAVRGGGHQWFRGAASCSGVTVDMRGLDSVVVSGDKSRVTVGAGATCDAVYETLDALGLSAAGGRVAGVGVAGLSGGGGHFVVVLADGSVVEASEQQNSDLWLELRGGCNNFGIITSLDIKTFEQGLLWSSLTLNPLSAVDQQARVYAELMDPAKYDENASFFFGWSFNSTHKLSVALNQLIYTKPSGDEVPAFYQPVLDLPTIPYPSAGATVANMSTLARQGVSLQPPQAARYLSTTVTFVPTEAMIRATFDAYNASLPSVQDIAGIRWDVNLEALPPQLYARGAQDNALGLADRSGPLAVCLLSPAWSRAGDDDKVYAAARALMDEIDRRARDLGAHDPYIYMNYAAPGQEVIASYGQASVAHLQHVRARVDPHGLFTHQVPGGFKIPQ
ncbi:FAD/FMN-binding dehydrogenase [Metarhizium robertsii]|uniref:FAD-binding, type 2 n=2 Tax=Metarhizium robertsii TaxID=568076 RepID=E9EK02_METRA|nr:FAD-binding, type 2 [Metarhizium robertsii ARSEF 23]EFZ03013.1 FAD-binding, type 2 [Metarhizium robertsii ARSEF 23]EXU98878.1 FAD/FMN-binding dehydrogenase [Metarhizium robertsii]